MQRDKFAKIRLRPNKATNIEITQERLHPKYQLNVQPTSLATETGHLELFRLEASERDLPTFSARWDLKPNTIDIDLIGDAGASGAFKAGVSGYKGHHTAILSDSPRVYRIEIEAPAGIIFFGEVQFLGEGGLHLRDSFQNLTEQIKDELTILVGCHHCGFVKVSGPPFVLDCCPKCRRRLPSDPE